MFIRKICRPTIIISGIATLAMISAIHVSADTKVKHVFELFTSQGCYSCPPAEKLLGEVIDRNDGILGLEFHVDYWDNLVYGSAGKWRDPFSSAAYSKRQRDYNRLRLEGRTGVYTPQMIVDGRHAFVGSKVSTAREQIGRDSNLVLNLTADVSNSGDLTINVNGDYDSNADVWVVIYDEKHVTEVNSGENMGKTLNNFNVVREFRPIGKWKGLPVEIETNVGSLDENQNCAVIVQKFDLTRQTVSGPIVGAAVCRKLG